MQEIEEGAQYGARKREPSTLSGSPTEFRQVASSKLKMQVGWAREPDLVKGRHDICFSQQDFQATNITP